MVGQALAAQYRWTFFFAQSFIPAVNGVLLGSLLYQSRLVPRWLPVLGLFGSVLLVASWLAVLVGFIGAVSRGVTRGRPADPVGCRFRRASNDSRVRPITITLKTGDGP